MWVEVWGPRGWGPGGWGPGRWGLEGGGEAQTWKMWGPKVGGHRVVGRRLGTTGWGREGWGPKGGGRKVGAKISRFFRLFRPSFCSFSPISEVFRGIPRKTSEIREKNKKSVGRGKKKARNFGGPAEGRSGGGGCGGGAAEGGPAEVGRSDGGAWSRHHMLANSLADVVAEEAAKRLLRDMNSEQNAWESVGRRGWLWCTLTSGPNAKGRVDIYEFDELLEPPEVLTLSSLERLEGEIANTGHLLVRHESGLRCQSCNLYRARRQLKFWSKTPCVPRPSSGDVIASFSAQKRKYNMAIQLTADR